MLYFHDKIVLNKHLLSLFGREAVGTKILSKDAVEILKELKLTAAKGQAETYMTLYWRGRRFKSCHSD